MPALQLTPTAMTDDNWHSLAELLGILGQRAALIEGFLQAQTNDMLFRYGDETQPKATDGGILVAASSGVGIGPVRDPLAAWDLRVLWVRNKTAGSNTTVVLQGVGA